MSKPVVSADGRYTLIYANHLNPRPDFIRENDGERPWRPFLKGVSGMFRGVVCGDRFIAITDDDAPRGRLVSIPLATPVERDTWRELLPGSDAVLASLIAVGDRIVLVDLVDTYARLRVLRPDGEIEGEIELPGRGVVNIYGTSGVAIAFMECAVPVGDDDLVFVFSTLTQAPALYRASVLTRTTEALTQPKVRLDAVVADRRATSADGTTVPYRVVTPRDVDASRPQPAILYAYGGFNIALLPGWPGEMLGAWVQAGGTLVIAHARGGGEFGPDWWRAALLERRQHCFDDVYAVAEDCIARGTTVPERLGVHGISNGGMVAAVAAVQRPDLFRAAIPQVPCTDMLAVGRDPLSLKISRTEDGDPNDPAMSEVLFRWSPYQNVVDGVRYPAMLVDCGANDPRCPAWHSRKLVARMQRATSSGRPVLLRVRAGAGHMAVGEDAQRAQQAEFLAFFSDELGLAR